MTVEEWDIPQVGSGLASSTPYHRAPESRSTFSAEPPERKEYQRLPCYKASQMESSKNRQTSRWRSCPTAPLLLSLVFLHSYLAHPDPPSLSDSDLLTCFLTLVLCPHISISHGGITFVTVYYPSALELYPLQVLEDWGQLVPTPHQ